MLVDWVCLGLMLVLVVDVFLGVWSRYVLQATFQWYDEVARLCFVWMVFPGAGGPSGAAPTFRLHLLIDRLGPRLRRSTDLVVGLLVGAFGCVLVRRPGQWPVARRQVSDSLELSCVVLRRAAIGGALMIPSGPPALRLGPQAMLLVCTRLLCCWPIGVRCG